MKKVVSLILALVMCLSLCACGNKKEEERISNLIADAMAQNQLTAYDINIKDRNIEAPGFEELSNTKKLELVRYLYFEDIEIDTISDGASHYHYEPFSIAENAPTPGLYKGTELVLDDLAYYG